MVAESDTLRAAVTRKSAVWYCREARSLTRVRHISAKGRVAQNSQNEGSNFGENSNVQGKAW